MADSKPTKDVWDALRKPFPKEAVGQMNRGGMKLDYVGHAAVTDRLNNVAGVDGWNWEPLSVDEHGLPRLDRANNLWIKLTINGVTKLGVGDGKNAKEIIGDALRNAAMRFGVALDLWSKEELESNLADPSNKNDKPSARAAAPPIDEPLPPAPSEMPLDEGFDDMPVMASPIQKKRIAAYLRSGGVDDKSMGSVLRNDFGVADPSNMTKDEAETVLAEIKTWKETAA